jgi:hypothetical protein
MEKPDLARKLQPIVAMSITADGVGSVPSPNSPPRQLFWIGELGCVFRGTPRLEWRVLTANRPRAGRVAELRDHDRVNRDGHRTSRRKTLPPCQLRFSSELNAHIFRESEGRFAHDCAQAKPMLEYLPADRFASIAKAS